MQGRGPPVESPEGPSLYVSLSVYISLSGYAVASAPGNRPLRHRQGALGCGAASGPQQERRHAVDDVENVLADVREVALG